MNLWEYEDLYRIVIRDYMEFYYTDATPRERELIRIVTLDLLDILEKENVVNTVHTERGTIYLRNKNEHLDV